MWRDGVLANAVIADDVLGLTVFSQHQIKTATRALAERGREICALDRPQHVIHGTVWLNCSDGSFVAWHRANQPEIDRETEIQRLSSCFNFRNQAVNGFLERHPALFRVLFEARKKFDEYFGANTIPSLEVFIDPEDDHSNPKLFALIPAAAASREASAVLDKLDEEWWLDQPYEIRRLVNIDVEYVDAAI